MKISSEIAPRSEKFRDAADGACRLLQKATEEESENTDVDYDFFSVLYCWVNK